MECWQLCVPQVGWSSWTFWRHRARRIPACDDRRQTFNCRVCPPTMQKYGNVHCTPSNQQQITTRHVSMLDCWCLQFQKLMCWRLDSPCFNTSLKQAASCLSSNSLASKNYKETLCKCGAVGFYCRPIWRFDWQFQPARRLHMLVILRSMTSSMLVADPGRGSNRPCWSTINCRSIQLH